MPVGQRGGGRLVYDPQNLEAGNLPGLLGRGALVVIEVCRHGDDRLRDVLAEVVGRVIVNLRRIIAEISSGE